MSAKPSGSLSRLLGRRLTVDDSWRVKSDPAGWGVELRGRLFKVVVGSTLEMSSCGSPSPWGPSPSPCPSASPRPWRRIVKLPSSANGRFSDELPLPPELGWGEDGGFGEEELTITEEGSGWVMGEGKTVGVGWSRLAAATSSLTGPLMVRRRFTTSPSKPMASRVFPTCKKFFCSAMPLAPPPIEDISNMAAMLLTLPMLFVSTSPVSTDTPRSLARRCWL